MSVWEVKLRHEAGRVRGFAAGNLPFLKQHHVCPAKLGKMVCNLRTNDAPANNHNLRLILHFPLSPF
jgi:hypothetical protein